MPDADELVIRPLIDRFADLLPEEQRLAASQFLVEVLRADPSLLHLSLPVAAYLMQEHPDWQHHLEVPAFVAACQQRADADVVRMLAAVPADGRTAQADFLAAIANEIKAALWHE